MPAPDDVQTTSDNEGGKLDVPAPPPVADDALTLVSGGIWKSSVFFKYFFSKKERKTEKREKKERKRKKKKKKKEIRTKDKKKNRKDK